MTRWFIAALALALVVGMALGSGAQSTMERIEAHLGQDINLRLNGSPWSPTDGDGTPLAPIIYRGRTYLPVRAMSEALGMDIDWDGATRTVHIGGQPASSPADPPAGTVKTEAQLTLAPAVSDWAQTLRQDEGVHTRDDEDTVYVLIAMGERPTGGYSVELVGAELKSGVWEVRVRYREPGPDDMVTQAFTYPYLLLALSPRADVTVIRVGSVATTELVVYDYNAGAYSDNVIVTSPIPYQLTRGQIRITGRARGTAVTVDLEDGHNVLVSGLPLSVSPGDPGWVVFDQVITYPTPSSPIGTLIVTAGPHVTLVPVRLGDWAYDAR